MALPDAGFSRDEPYRLLHPDDQQVVDRVWQEVAQMFQQVTQLIEAEAEAQPMGVPLKSHWKVSKHQKI